jgi:bifunctional non-homologous end joining protein LigD
MVEPEPELIEVASRTVAISHPNKVLFPRARHTKIDLARYYVAVADAALRGAGGRPNMLVRYPNGIGAEFFYQKRAPRSRPDWVEVVELRFPSGRSAEEVVPRDAAALAWLANPGDAPWPPHYRKQQGEPPRVRPSKARAANKRPLRPAQERRDPDEKTSSSS